MFVQKYDKYGLFQSSAKVRVSVDAADRKRKEIIVLFPTVLLYV